MKLVSLIDEDFVNYKRASMLLATPYCDFKCNKDAGCEVCHNMHLAAAERIEIDYTDLMMRYLKNPITSAIVFAGLEPFYSGDPDIPIIRYQNNDTFSFVRMLRNYMLCNDDIVFYSGYTEEELEKTIILDFLSHFPNTIVKFGRFIPNREPRFDEVLGVILASDNQYAKYIGPKIDY